MGLFDKVIAKDSGTESLNKADAFAAIGLATVAVDGVITEE